MGSTHKDGTRLYPTTIPCALSMRSGKRQAWKEASGHCRSLFAVLVRDPSVGSGFLHFKNLK
eukprot:scaffold3502_cov183-Amphora_coffeaeformis.AAC.3